jgi:hypothetical protein
LKGKFSIGENGRGRKIQQRKIACLEAARCNFHFFYCIQLLNLKKKVP